MVPNNYSGVFGVTDHDKTSKKVPDLPRERYTRVTTSSMGISENFHGNWFRMVTRGLSESLITNITFKNVTDIPGECYTQVTTSSTGICENYHGNKFKLVTRGFSGSLIPNITSKNVPGIPKKRYDRVTTSSTGISENFYGHWFKIVTRGFSGSLVTIKRLKKYQTYLGNATAGLQRRLQEYPRIFMVIGSK